MKVRDTSGREVHQEEINMGTHKIINVVDPAANQDAATKKYVDDNAGLWEIDGTETQLKTADEIDMQTKKIINVVDPAADQDAATKKYVDDNAISYPQFAVCLGAYTGSSGDWELIMSRYTNTLGSMIVKNTTTPVSGDYVEYKVSLLAGTYRCAYGLVRNTNRGIVKFYVDDVLKDTYDCYHASAEGIARNVSFIIATSKDVTLKWIVDGKNGSSSGYLCEITTPMVGRTA